MTKPVAFAEIYNTVLRFREEFEGLSDDSQRLFAEEYFRQLTDLILEVCEDANDG